MCVLVKHSLSNMQYAAFAVHGFAEDLHMTISVMELKTRDAERKAEYALAEIAGALPVRFTFGEIAMLGLDNDVEVMLVHCDDAVVVAKIKAFHDRFIMPGHVSEGNYTMHVTTKGCAAEMQRAGGFVTNNIYIKRMGEEAPYKLFGVC